MFILNYLYNINILFINKMSNILNNNRVPFITKLNCRDCWDFCLASDNLHYMSPVNLETCTVTTIDLNKGDCVWFDVLYGNKEWEGAVNDGIMFNNIGYTGVDNGLISYKKDRLSNKNFLNLFLNSQFEIPSTDKRLQLHKVNGNNQIFDYTTRITYIDNDETQVLECNGGFYQGFWKSETSNYQVLPNLNDENLCFEFELKPSTQLENNEYTLNSKYPQNKGIFFYLGTRSENKFWKYYDTIDFEKSLNEYFSDDYLTEDFTLDKINTEYITDNTYEDLLLKYLEVNGYINREYINYAFEDFQCECVKGCTSYFNDDYIASEVIIEENEIIEENKLSNPKKNFEIKTNNKFLFFDRTCEGFKTTNWDENTQIVIEDYKRPNIGNYFTLFNRTCEGHTIHTIQKVIDKKLQEYDVLADLYNNAIAFQIKENGCIGYKYLVKDCDSNTYEVLSEYSKENIVTSDQWSKIRIDIQKCLDTPLKKLMEIKIYVNNKLKLVSQKLPFINFRSLNDDKEKQEGVAYNISLGGGTQGLIDVIYPRYTRLPEYTLPLEKVFAGTFIGYIKTFTVLTCTNNSSSIFGNESRK